MKTAVESVNEMTTVQRTETKAMNRNRIDQNIVVLLWTLCFMAGTSILFWKYVLAPMMHM